MIACIYRANMCEEIIDIICIHSHPVIMCIGNSEYFPNNSITRGSHCSSIPVDAGINWDGRTVRAPGDTVIWEVLTIANTHDNWMAVYADDINYFFAHICPIDTSDHSKFHIKGL